MKTYETIEVLPLVWEGAEATCLISGETLERRYGSIVCNGQDVVLSIGFMQRKWVITYREWAEVIPFTPRKESIAYAEIAC